MSNDWCILRCSGRHTMSLAQSLADDGFEAWTPIETRTVHVPRLNAKREVRQPIMPSYVFARVTHLVDLLELSKMPVKPRRGKGMQDAAHAGFSVLHAFGGIPVVPDKHLTRLRQLEQRSAPKPKAQDPLKIGIGVRIKGGAAQGLRGTVEQSNRTHTVVSVNDRYTIKILTCLLDPDELCNSNIPAALQAA